MPDGAVRDAPRGLFSYRVDEVGVVVLDRPEARNALGSVMLRRLEEELAGFSDAGAIVLAAEGPHFCVGADLVEVSGVWGDRRRVSSFLELFHEVTDGIAGGPVPVIAAVQGCALAGGLELALACDLILAAEDAELGDQHVNMDLIPGGGGSQRLPRAIGARRALGLQLLGDRIGAEQARAWGLVQGVIPRKSLRREAIAVGKAIASRDRTAVLRIRELGDAAARLPLPEGLSVELATAIDHLSSSPRPRALRRFADKAGEGTAVPGQVGAKEA